MHVCLEHWLSFKQVWAWLVIHKDLALPCNFYINKYMFIVIFKTWLSYFKRTIIIVLIQTKIGIVRYFSLSTLLLLCFECTGMESVSDSESNVSVLNRGNEPIIIYLYCFVSKLGCVPPVSTFGIGMGSRFRFLTF